jgi:HSP20 family protein
MPEPNQNTGKRKARPAGESEPEINIDLGLGGLFKGLSNFMDALGDLVEKAEPSEETRSGEFKVKGLGDKAKGVYGFSIRSGIAGGPRVEPFGNIRSTKEGPVVSDTREPLVDVFDEEREVLIVAELPGVAEAEIQADVQDDILTLTTTGERKFAKEILLPASADPGSLRKTYTNGILELRLSKR